LIYKHNPLYLAQHKNQRLTTSYYQLRINKLSKKYYKPSAIH